MEYYEKALWCSGVPTQACIAACDCAMATEGYNWGGQMFSYSAALSPALSIPTKRESQHGTTKINQNQTPD